MSMVYLYMYTVMVGCPNEYRCPWFIYICIQLWWDVRMSTDVHGLSIYVYSYGGMSEWVQMSMVYLYMYTAMVGYSNECRCPWFIYICIQLWWDTLV